MAGQVKSSPASHLHAHNLYEHQISQILPPQKHQKKNKKTSIHKFANKLEIKKMKTPSYL